MSKTDSIAWLNGDFIPFRDARLPVFDLGIVQAATITERLRTFRHVPYLVEEHLQRLRQSASKIGLASPLLENLNDVILEVARKNSSLIGEHSELSIVIFATAGQALGDANGLVTESEPTVCVYSAPLPLARYAAGYWSGLPLLTPDLRQISAISIDPEIKMRSRLHWYLADQQVRNRDPEAHALLLNDQGHLTETSSGNLFLVKHGMLFTTEPGTTLAGISQQVVIRIAEQNGIAVQRCSLVPDDLHNADEAFLTSSTYCIMPVASYEGTTLPSVPGSLTTQLQHLWSDDVEIDFVVMSRQCAASKHDSPSG